MKTNFLLLSFLLVFSSECVAKDLFVRPAGGNYGSEDGSSYENAWDGLKNVKFGASENEVGPGDTLYVCGTHIYEMNNSGNFATEGQIMLVAGTGLGSRVKVRGDYPGDPGVVWGCFLPKYENWAKLDAISFANWNANTTYQTKALVKNDAGTHIFQVAVGGTSAAGEPSWNTAEGSVTNDGTVQWVCQGAIATYSNVYSINQKVPAKPIQNLVGLNFEELSETGELRELRNTQGAFYAEALAYNKKIFIHCKDSSNPIGSDIVYFRGYGYTFIANKMEYVEFKSIKFPIWNKFWSNSASMPSHLRIDGCYLSHYKNWFIDPGIHYLELLNSEICYAENGPYTRSISVADRNLVSSNNVFRGNFIHDIGNTKETGNDDAHGLGFQGGHDTIVENNFFLRCGTGPMIYVWAGQDCYNYTIRYNRVKDSQQFEYSPGQRSTGWGIAQSCDSDAIANLSNHLIAYNIIENCSVGIRTKFKDTVRVYNNTIVNCDYGIQSSFGYLDYGPRLEAKNNIIYNSKIRHFHFVGATMPKSLLASDYNLFYPDGPGSFQLGDFTYSFSTWKSMQQVYPSHILDLNSNAVDPLFNNFSAGNFTLTAKSPAINTGVNVGQTKDYKGTAIVINPDKGALEFSNSSLSAPVGVRVVSP